MDFSELTGDDNGAVVNEMNTMNNNNAFINSNINNNTEDGSLLHSEFGSKKDKELFEMAEKLYSLRNDPAYLKYFFLYFNKYYKYYC